MSEGDARQQLIHQVNNLLGVIQMQTEAARAVDTSDAMRRALELIENSAQRTARRVRELQQEIEGGQTLS